MRNNGYEGYNYGDSAYENGRNNYPNCNNYEEETHNHEFLTSTNYDENDECEIHNHRTVGVTGPAIPCKGSHIHKVEAYVDTFEGHIHKICDVTGPALRLPNGKHIHVVKGETSKSESNNHDHAYYFATLIDNPSDIKEDKC